MTNLPLPNRRLVLASGSPRRRDLLSSIGVAFDVVTAEIDESPIAGEAPAETVARLSREKAAAVRRVVGDSPILAADTEVALDGRVMGKPADAAAARAMLRALSGRVHTVYTAVCFLSEEGEPNETVEEADVSFRELDDADVAWYIQTGEWVGVAGAYRLQEAGAALISQIRGNPTTVVGLPLHRVRAILRRAGVA